MQIPQFSVALLPALAVWTMRYLLRVDAVRSVVLLGESRGHAVRTWVVGVGKELSGERRGTSHGAGEFAKFEGVPKTTLLALQTFPPEASREQLPGSDAGTYKMDETSSLGGTDRVLGPGEGMGPRPQEVQGSRSRSRSPGDLTKGQPRLSGGSRSYKTTVVAVTNARR